MLTGHTIAKLVEVAKEIPGRREDLVAGEGRGTGRLVQKNGDGHK